MISEKAQKNILFFIGFLIFGSVLSLILRKVPEWDFYSYHYYNGWAFFNDRLNIDFLPASYRTYFNPVIDAFNYIVLKYSNDYPFIFFFINGFKTGIFLFFTYLTSDYVFKENKYRPLLNVAVLFLTIFSPILIHVSSFDYIHVQISVLLLAAFYFFIKNIYKEKTKKEFLLLFLASLLFGLAFGFRYTATGFGVGFLVCILFFKKNIPSFYKTLTTVFLGAFIGFLVSDGWWLWLVYKHFNNPFFPYFNNIFNSYMGDNSSVLVSDYQHLRPGNPFEFIFYPLLNTRLWYRIGEEISFFDFKTPLIFIFTCAFLLVNGMKLISNETKNTHGYKCLEVILVFIVATYYSNLILFTRYGYIIGLIPLVSTALVLFLQILHDNFEKTKSFIKGFNIFLFAVFLFYVITDIHKVVFTEFKIYIIFLLLFIIFVILSMPKRNYTEKVFCTTVFALLISVTILYCSSTFGKGSNSFNYKVIDIENMNIEDNATVLNGTLITSFIIPHQNPKTKYIHYTPPHYAPAENFSANSYMANTNYYYSSFSENMIKNAFKNSENLYFVFSVNELQKLIRNQRHYRNMDELQKDYVEQFKFYSVGEVNSFGKCRDIRIVIFGKIPRSRNMVLCKLK